MTAALVLEGCGSQPPAMNLPAALHESRRLANPETTGGSWMSPDARHRDLLYVANQGFSDMLVFGYPDGKTLGKINGFGRYPFGLCVDQKQDVWVTAETDLDKFSLTEYAHGGIHRKDKVDDHAGTGLGCGIDPTSGDLAIVNESGPQGSGQGNIAIYSFGSRSTKLYQDPKIYLYFAAAYDSAGDLFVVGFDQGEAPKFAELPHGGSKFLDFKLDRQITRPSDVLWDGQYVVVAAGDDSELYRYAISGSTATLHDKIGLFGEYDTAMWIDGSRIVGGDGQNNVYYWTYPGGDSKKVIHGGHISEPVATAVSRGTQAR